MKKLLPLIFCISLYSVSLLAQATGFTFASDDFSGSATGTNLTAHTADVGNPWVKQGASVGDIIVTSAGRARMEDSGTTAYYLTGTPLSADYDVNGDVVRLTNVASSVSVAGRMVTGDLSKYSCGHAFGSGWRIEKWSTGGTPTTVANSASNISDGNSYPVSLRFRGNVITCVTEFSTLS